MFDITFPFFFSKLAAVFLASWHAYHPEGGADFEKHAVAWGIFGINPTKTVGSMFVMFVGSSLCCLFVMFVMFGEYPVGSIR